MSDTPHDKTDAPPMPGPEREAYIHKHDCPRIWDFWKKYALGSKLCPSCLLCGKPEHDPERWAIRHAELPDIYICKTCVDAARCTPSAVRHGIPEQLRGEERAKYIHEHDCPKVWDFWRKHALGSKLCPSCLLCGQQRADRAEEWAITHAELPDIYICKVCVDAARRVVSDTRNGYTQLAYCPANDRNRRNAG